MKNTNSTQILGGILAISLLAVGAMTPAGRAVTGDLLTSLGASAGSSRYQLSVTLNTSDGRNYEYISHLSDADVRQLRNDPEEARDHYLMAAKKAMAEKLGYHESRYGADAYKMLSSPRLMAFKVVDSSTGQATNMFRDERVRTGFSSIYAE